MNDKTDTVTFSFGANWLNYLDTVTATELGAAGKSLVALLGVESLHGKTFLDIGCGSGLFSAAAKALGATRVISIDVDPLSVAATEQLREKSPGNSSWQILHGSILVESFAHSLPRADIVYSWGVLHHTGSMWTAIDNAADRVTPGGTFAIAIYNRCWSSGWWWQFKHLYNRTPSFIQKLLVVSVFAPRVVVRLLRGKHPLKSDRGMSIYFDAVDWAGGFPYEYACFDEIVEYAAKHNMQLINSVKTSGTGCNQFVFTKTENR